VRAFTSVTGTAIPLDRVDVDTDQIIPKQFLKRVERSGYGDFLFYDWRFLPDGSPNPSFELNHAAYKGGTILLAGRNFGCGSSREHAAWALADFGIRSVIAPSFADIFLSNCFQNGILPVALPEALLKELIVKAQTRPGHRLTVDLERRAVSDDDGWSASFEVDAFRRDMLLRGLDEIDLTLTHLDEIRAFEEVSGL
jgi:3-isopropylmalate/(R)-2-methylmalate dehydratase small subunit